MGWVGGWVDGCMPSPSPSTTTSTFIHFDSSHTTPPPQISSPFASSSARTCKLLQPHAISGYLAAVRACFGGSHSKNDKKTTRVVALDLRGSLVGDEDVAAVSE